MSLVVEVLGISEVILQAESDLASIPQRQVQLAAAPSIVFQIGGSDLSIEAVLADFQVCLDGRCVFRLRKAIRQGI